MASDYTTLRVKKSTRDLINKIATNKELSIDEFLTYMTRERKDTEKQILLTVDMDKYYTMQNLTNMLNQMKLIETPKIEDAVMLAVNNLINGMAKSFPTSQSSQSAPVMHPPGQINGAAVDASTSQPMGVERQ